MLVLGGVCAHVWFKLESYLGTNLDPHKLTSTATVQDRPPGLTRGFLRNHPTTKQFVRPPPKKKLFLVRAPSSWWPFWRVMILDRKIKVNSQFNSSEYVRSPGTKRHIRHQTPFSSFSVIHTVHSNYCTRRSPTERSIPPTASRSRPPRTSPQAGRPTIYQFISGLPAE